MNQSRNPDFFLPMKPSNVVEFIPGVDGYKMTLQACTWRRSLAGLASGQFPSQGIGHSLVEVPVPELCRCSAALQQMMKRVFIIKKATMDQQVVRCAEALHAHRITAKASDFMNLRANKCEHPK
jgi:hypothetical protein